MTARRSQTLLALLPDHVHAYEADLAPGHGNPAERRQREFEAGRSCAQAALRDAHVEGFVGRNEDRSPAWPTGTVGSIAHCAHLAVAVAAADTDLLGLGVDVEDQGVVSDELIPILLTPAERSSMTRSATDLTALFSMKEAAYKCWYPATAVVLDFVDIEVTVDPVTSTFRAAMVTSSRRRLRHVDVQGRYGIRDGHVFATAWMDSVGGATTPRARQARGLQLA